MKNYRKILMLAIIVSMNMLYATGTSTTTGTPPTTCTSAPTTDDITSKSITNTSGATDISLSGKDCSDNDVNSFNIVSLPTPNTGVLYTANGKAVTAGQTLTKADGLKFDPAAGFTGNAIFLYAAIDENGDSDATPASVTIPITAAGACTEAPTTDNKNNNNLLNTLGATDISNLSGKDCAAAEVTKFKIMTLPTANSGVLYMADGVTVVTVGQTLTKVEADGLKFDPKDGFTGDTTFTYAAIDSNGNVDDTPATFTIPVIAGAGVCVAPTTENIDNPNLLNTLGAVDILNLAGKDCHGDDVNKFRIVTLPAANSGVLYMADGVTAVTVGQTLTRAEADGLKFDPSPDFTGNATFTYVAIDNNGKVDDTPATVTIPVIAGAGGACAEAPTTEDLQNPNLLNTLGAVNILNLAGRDCAGTKVESFRIVSLPDAAAGVLYMADGVTAVTVGQTLTRAEANGLRFDPVDGFVGDGTFTYVAIDGNGNIDATPATVTLPLTNNGGAVTDIVANPDTATAQGNADPITINVLANDTGDLNGSRVYLLNPDGTVTDRLVVDGEGVWTVNADNTITFTPATGFVGTPTPVRYLVEDANGARSNSSLITITGNCICEDYTTSVPSLSVTSLLMLALLVSATGFFFARKEELN